MMSAEALDVRNRVARQTKQESRRDLSVMITGVTVFLAAVSLMIAGLSFFVAFSADQESEVLGIYVQKLHAQLIAEGFEPPPLPGEDNDP